MNKLIVSCLLLTGLCGLVSAQQADNFKRTEFYVGYAVELADSKARDLRDLHGFEASAVYNFMRFVGVKGDFSATFNEQRVAQNGYNLNVPFSQTFRRSNSLINALGGVQIKDNALKGKVKPFVHALIGTSFGNSTIDEYSCTSVQSCPFFLYGSEDRNGLAAALGGGLDLKIKNGVKVRVFQVDYNPVHFSSSNTQTNVRIGAGFVF